MTADRSDDTASVVALWRLQAAYADVISRRAWPELADLIAPDATIEVDTVTTDPHRIVGPQALAEFVGPAVERFDHFQFVILNAVVEIDAADTDSAHGRLFISEIRRDASTGEWSTTYGVYQDHYRRIADRWWITDRRYRSMARTGANAGAFGLPSGLLPFAR